MPALGSASDSARRNIHDKLRPMTETNSSTPIAPERCLGLVIDVQERLCPAMPESRIRDVMRSARILAGAAAALEVPIAASEQYPQGLGSTVPEVASLLDAVQARRFEKTRFSAVGVAAFDALLEERQPAYVALLGMEAHVCVWQTVRALRARSITPVLLTDGVCSRSEDHRAQALELCREVGAVLTTTEALVFDWVGDASHPAFKTVSKLVR